MQQSRLKPNGTEPDENPSYFGISYRGEDGSFELRVDGKLARQLGTILKWATIISVPVAGGIIAIRGLPL